MKLETVVSSSNQLTASLPSYIVENYEKFVEFMQEGLASQTRMGFGQDLLQNLHKYRDFSTYNKDLREFDYLKEDIGTGGIGGAQGIEVLGTSNDYSIITDQAYELSLGDTSVQLILNNADGFPLENGVLLIEDEIILYQYREGNVFYGLLRVLPVLLFFRRLHSLEIILSIQKLLHIHQGQKFIPFYYFLGGNVIHHSRIICSQYCIRQGLSRYKQIPPPEEHQGLLSIQRN